MENFMQQQTLPDVEIYNVSSSSSSDDDDGETVDDPIAAAAAAGTSVAAAAVVPPIVRVRSIPPPINLDLTIKATLFTKDAKVPTKASIGSAGFDIYSAGRHVIYPERVIKVQTDLGIEIPNGYYGLLSSRSGMVMIRNIMTIPGTIDSDYRGSVEVMLYNFSKNTAEIVRGEKIAYLIIHKIHPQNEITVVRTLGY